MLLSSLQKKTTAVQTIMKTDAPIQLILRQTAAEGFSFDFQNEIWRQPNLEVTEIDLDLSGGLSTVQISGLGLLLF